MKKSDLYFDLPQELIAQFPHGNKDDDRLLIINKKTGVYEDRKFIDIPYILPSPSVLVLNETKVRKARVFCKNDNGANVELLFLHPESNGNWTCMCSKRKRRKTGEKLYLDDKTYFIITSFNNDETISIQPSSDINEDFFLKNGHVPLPPYIKREDVFSDNTAYQTIFAKNLGSVASPTSGLHYSKKVLDEIASRCIEIVKITLHVGMGTFLPIREDDLDKHKMHSEVYEISAKSAEKLNNALNANIPIIASGTTVLRALESAYNKSENKIISGKSSTDIFITPGFKFNVASALVTNFHTPESTLLALVAAFSSLDIVKNAYKHAIEEKYHFFSYGDCTYFY